MNFPNGGKRKIIVLSFKGKIHIGVDRLGCERNHRIIWIIHCSHLNQACKIAVSRLWHTWPFIEEKARVLWRSFCSPGRRVAVSLVCHWCDVASFSISIAWYSLHMLVAGRCFRNNETRFSICLFRCARWKKRKGQFDYPLSCCWFTNSPWNVRWEFPIFSFDRSSWRHSNKIMGRWLFLQNVKWEDFEQRRMWLLMISIIRQVRLLVDSVVVNLIFSDYMDKLSKSDY